MRKSIDGENNDGSARSAHSAVFFTHSRAISCRREERERERERVWIFGCWLLVKAMNGCVEYVFVRARERERERDSTLSLSLNSAHANSLLLLFCLPRAFSSSSFSKVLSLRRTRWLSFR